MIAGCFPMPAGLRIHQPASSSGMEIMLQGSYSYPLVFASLFIATIASYTTLDLVGRISALGRSAYRVYWLIGGAVAMGLGIWSMHFVGMLSFSLPIPLGYDPTITFYSLLIACGVSYFALDLVTRGELSFARMTVSGVLMGLGIASMHYTGMAALRMQPEIDYAITILVASVLIAIVASIAALWLANALRTTQPGLLWLHRLGAALLMGLAITGMHYTGMAAARFPVDSVCRAATGISTNWLALSVGGTTLSILAITVVLSVLDARLQLRTSVFVKRLQHQATHDGLTGLPNRVLLTERIDGAIARHHQSGTPFAIFFIDLDGFKTINDSFGHNIGDAVLKDLSQRLQLVMRKDDMLARFGGDEFIVLAEGVTDDAAAARIAEKLLSSFRSAFKLPGIEMGLSPSIGIAMFPRDGDNVDTLLSHADAAMYQVKTSGRNNYRFFAAEMNVATLRLVTIQQGLQTARRENQLFLHYQPKFNCSDHTVQGAEALLRWQHPELGLISPAEFIPVAEKSGQIISVGHWVVEQVCRELNDWRAAGHALIPIAVNLSLVQLRAPNLVQDILAITARYGIPPEMLMLEITETAAMENADETRATVDKLKSVGFMLAIDDFGTGYSSLSHLQEFGVHQMKVDRAFIKTLTKEEGKSRSIVSAIISLAHALEMEVVAEGVETRAQLDVLQELRCDQTQGFLLARPMPKEEFIRLLQTAQQNGSRLEPA
jgi:diguanylate cyclase (GGDEF)-like protein